MLDSDEREGIINIMDSITSLTPEERVELNDVLKKTTLSRIIRTVSSIQNRLKVIEALKKLVYDETMFTNERDHIQKLLKIITDIWRAISLSISRCEFWKH